MKALVLKDVGKLKIEDISKPSPKQGEVLVHVKACGICGSDIPRAYKDGAHNMPLVIGHEFAGEVLEAGAGVHGDWIGKSVGIFPLIPCKKCQCCIDKKYEMCKNYSYLGSRVDGGFAEYVAVPEWNLIELGSSVLMEQAAMMEPMAVAVHAIRQVLKAKGYDIGSSNLSDLFNSNVVVMGLGTIGLLVTMFLKDLGFENVYTIGNKKLQKEKVMELGVDEEHYVSEVSDVDIFFECIGSNESLLTGISAAAPGGVVCTVGNPHSDMDIPRNVYWQILRNQLKIVGTWNSSFTHDLDDDWHYVLGRLQQGAVKPEKLITHKLELANIVDGFELMRDKKEEYVKVMAEIGDV
ncbi:MAG: galactitol-1-phosphate 5-dehydrogenase [Pseudobutyrivibrio ruminis]|nr:galactitol-1-phosphate 5-dehydrogenase [Pseudobutyrivibrio ruminis]